MVSELEPLFAIEIEDMSDTDASAMFQSAWDKVSRLQADMSPLLFRDMGLDFETGRALYLSQERALIQVATVPLCSFGTDSRTYQWAWANPGIALDRPYAQEAFQELAEKTGLDEFIQAGTFALSDEEARNFLALVMDHLGGLGLISKSSEQTIWSFMITSIERDLDQIDIPEAQAQQLLYDLVDQEAVATFNAVRAKLPEFMLSFAGADLRGDPQPWKGDLHTQTLLDYGYLTAHQLRTLDGINFSKCRLDEANLRGVSLKNASFRSASLVDADLTNADLRRADFEQAFLNGANFTAAKLDGSRFAEAELGRTLFVDTDLSSTTGLENTRHSIASEISFSTLVKSSFQVSESFMLGAGVSIGLIDDLRRGQRFASTYATCFLSYSSKDTPFAQRLYYALLEAGVRVFWDRMDLTVGEHLDVQLTKAIREHDRTIAILSDSSLESAWLKREVEIALYYKPDGFTPIRLCDIAPIQSFVAQNDIKPDIVDRYPILDFAAWQVKAEFERCRDVLLKSIRR